MANKPANTVATVSCPADAVDPGNPGSITDACGRTVTAVLIGSVLTPPAFTCNGSVVWTYRYTACDGSTADWTKTYTVTYSGGLTPPSNGSSTVAGPAQAVNPGAPANITDACGRSVSASYVGVVQTPDPVVCEGSIVYTYRYTACDGTTTADWTYTYNVTKISISGTVKYNNASATAMNLVTVTLTPTTGAPVSCITDAGGNYAFSIPLNTAVCPDNYKFTFTTAKGVGGINSTDAARVNAWWTGSPVAAIEYVKYLTGDVTGEDFINASDAAAIQQYFVFGTAFGRKVASGTPWVFWKELDQSSLNPPRSTTPLKVLCTADKTVNILGGVIGDFNFSFTPSILVKSASSTLQLIYNSSKRADAGTEVELPVRIMHASTVSAVSLILNFPANLAEVKDVTMKANSGNLSWSVTGNELRIGWNSAEPQNFAAIEDLLVIRLKTSEKFSHGDAIRLELAADQLNELADGDVSVIPDAVLGVDVLEFSTNGIVDPTIEGSMTLNTRPNPFASYTILSYNLPAAGQVTLVVSDMLGRQVATLVNVPEDRGSHSVNLDAMSLQPGVYFATLTLRNSTGELVRTIKLVRNR